MINLPVFVGLDYHQDSIQVCVLNPQGDVLLNRSAGNDCDQLARLVHARALKLQVGAVLREQRVKIDADRGSRWSKSWTSSVRDNDRLSQHARWIVNDLLDDLLYNKGKIAAAEVKLREAAAGDRVIEKLMRQPGIGEVTAWVLRACVGDFSRFKTAKQLSRYCGLSPCNVSSGKRVADAGLIDGANKMLRATIVQAAHRLIRTVDRWRNLAESLKRRGKAPCVIVGAVGNRWVRTLHHAMEPGPATISAERKQTT